MDKEYNPDRKLTAREKIEAEDNKIDIIMSQYSQCAHCGQMLTASEPIDIAHRIPKYKMYIKKYGWSVINHRFNLRATHRGACNDGVLLDPKTHPIEAQQLVKRIMEDLKK